MKTLTNSSATKAQPSKANRRILATSISALLAVTLLGLVPKAKADIFWDGAGTGVGGGDVNVVNGGSGTWDFSTTANWTTISGAGPDFTYSANPNPAHFLAPSNGSGVGTVSVASNLFVGGGLEFDGGSYTFNTAGVGAFNLGLGNLIVDLNSGTPVTQTFNVQIINAGAMVINNTGAVGNTVVLTNTTNNYNGGTTLNGTSILLNNAATSALGSGVVTIAGTGSTFGTSSAGAVSIANTVNVNANFNLTSGAGGLTLTDVNLGAVTRTITGLAGTTTINGTISGGAGSGVTYDGSNTRIIYGANETSTYTGLTTVQNGATLTLSSTVANTAIKGDLTISSGGTVNQTVTGEIATSATVTVNTAGIWNLNSNTELIKTLNSGANGGTVNLGAAGGLQVNNGNFSGNITGANGTLLKLGLAADVLTLSGTNSYSGVTTITHGTIRAGSVSGLSSASAFNLINTDSTLDLGGFNNSISSLTGVAGSTVTNSGFLAPSVLTVLAGASTTFAGNMVDGAGLLGLVKSGATTLTLSGTNTYSGSTTITAGSQITAGSVTGLSANSAFVVQTSTVLALNGFNNTIASLSDGLTTGGIVNNSGAANAVLTFGGNGTPTRFNGLLTNGGGAGNLGITKVGAGVTTLGGANNYTGATTITGGTIRAGVANTLSATSDHIIGAAGTLDIGGLSQTIGSLAGVAGAIVTNNTISPATLTTNALLNASTQFGGVIQDGPGGGILALTKQGTGILKLTGLNTYTGATTISAGTLQTGVVNALSTGTDVNVAAAATFDLNNVNQSIGSLAGAAGSFVTLGTAVLTTGNNSAVNTAFSGVISGPNVTSGLTKVGTGIFTLDGAAANTYAGPTRANDGVLILSKTAGLNATGTGAGGLFIGDGVGAAGSAIVRLGAAGQIADTTAVTLASDGRFDLNNNSETVGSIAGVAGAQIALGSATLTTGDIGNTTYAGDIGGTGGVTKQGTGAWTLSGNNTYTGATLVSAGALVAGSTTAFAALSAFTVNATLDLNGKNNSIGSLAGTGIVRDTGAAATLTITGNNGAAANFSGQLIDGGVLSLVKNGPGTQILSGSNVNTYTGSTTVNGGILQAGAINAFSPSSATLVNTGGTLDLAGFANTILSLSDSGVPGGTVTNTGAATTLTFGDANSLIFRGNITGAGANALSLVKNGTGVQTLAGVNTYTGTTTINAGGIKAGSATALGNGSNFNLNANNVTLDLAGFSNTIGTLTGLAGSIVQNSTGVPATLTTNAAAASTFAGNIVNGGGAPLALTKTGAGVLTLSGNNTYGGPTTVNAGGLTAGSLTALSANSALINQVGGTVSLNGFNNTVLSLSDGGTAGGALNNGAGGNAVLTFGDATNTRFNGVVSNGAAGTLGLTKQGGGATTLGGANTYTGPTTIIAGRLIGGNATSFGNNSAVELTTAGATLDIGGTSVSIGSLTGVAGTIVTDSVANATLTTGGLNQNTTFAGNIIDGPGAILSLNKTGTGIQTLSGNNTYTGTTTIGNGVATSTLLAGSTTALSAGSAFQINANGLLDLGGFNNTILSLSGIVGGSIRNSGLPNAVLQFGDGNANTFAGTIVSGPIGSGTLGLTKVGGGTQILSGANTYTGPTTVNAGRLQAGVASVAGVSGAFGFNSAVKLTNAGTTLDLATFNNTIGSLNGGVGTFVQGNGSTLTTGALNSPDAFAGVIQDGGGAFGLTKVGTGTMTLSAINTYTGATTVNGGKLLAGSAQAFGVNSAVTVNNGGNLDLGGNNNTVGSLNGTAVGVVQNSVAAAILTTGGGGGSGNFSGNIVNGTAPLSLTKIGIGTQTLSGINAYTGPTTVNGGSLVAGSTTGLSTVSAHLVNTGGTLGLNGFSNTILSLSDNGVGQTGIVQNGAAANAVLTFGDTNNLAFHGTIVNGGAGTLGLTKSGTGKEILTGISTYTGPTIVNAGTLQVEGSIASALVNVKSGATLAGFGTVGGVGSTTTIEAGGHLAPGASPGTITIGGNLILDSLSLSDYELGTPGVVTVLPPFINDLTVVNGNLTLDGTLSVTNAGGFGPGAYRLFNYTGALTNNTLDVNPVPGGFTTYVTTNIANQVNLIVLANPGAGAQFWDGPNLVGNGIVDGGTSTWSNVANSNWTDAVGAANSNWNNGTAVFQGTAGTVTLADDINFQGLVFNTSGYVINAGAAPFTLLANGAVTITTANVSATINAVIADDKKPGAPLDSITTNGGGTLILAGLNTYTGGTTINDGIVSVSTLANGGAASGIGQSGNAAANLVLNGGTLQYTGAAVSTDRLFSVGTNGGKLDSSGAGAVNFNNVGAMGFNAQAGTRTLELTGTNVGANTLATAIGNNGGATSLVKNGAGTWVLSGINNYSGTTTINAGTLRAGSVTGLSNTSAFLVNGGGTLDVNGFVSTILSLSDNGVGPVFGTVTNNGAVATVLTFGDANNLTFRGNIVNGASVLGITKVGTGIEILSGNNTYTGPTTINAGTLQAGSITAFGVNSLVAVNLGGTFDLGGFSNSVGALTSTVPGGTVRNTGALAATLTITGTGLPQTFAGNIVNTGGAGALSLTKNGAGTQILSGVNTYNGVTTIGGGVLMAGSTTAFGTNSAVNITVAGANTGLDLGGFNNSIGSLQGIVASIATTTNGPAVLTTGGNGVNATFAGNLVNGVIAPGINVLSLTKVGPAIQTLSGVNTYTGATNVNGGTLQAGSSTALSATSAFLVNTGGILDLNGFNNTILSLTDTGAPGGTIQNGAAGNAVLTFGDANNLTFRGNIIAGPGAGTLGITKNGTGKETLSGVNTYTGATTINNGALLAGSTTAFSGLSAVNLTAAGATLDLNTFNNSIFSLTGVAGSFVKDTGVGGATLTITNGGGANFAGNMIDDGPLALHKSGPGTQILSGINTYSGDTIIDGGILQAGSTTAFSPNSDFLVNTGGTLSLAGFSNTILTLSDNGAPGGIVQNGAAGNAVLTFGDANNLTFNGRVQDGGAGTLGLTKNGTGAQTMTGLNTYTGPTTVNAGRLIAGSISAYGVNSAVTLGNGGTLDLGGFNNTIGSLAGIPGSTVQNSTGIAATLTTGALGSTLFAGNIVNGAGAPLALTKVGAGTMTVSGVNTYTGATNVNAGVLQAGSITALSAGSAHSVNTGGTLALNGFNNTILSLTDTGAPGGTVQNGGAANAILTFGDANNLTFRGVIQNGGAGTLGITKNGTGAQTHSGVNTYTGPTTINNGKLIGGSTSAFGVNSAVNITAAGGTLDLGSFNNTIGSLTGVAGSTVTDSIASATLTTGTLNQNTTFAGNMIDGPGAVLSLTKTGTGIQTLSGNNTYSGGTIINAGEILAGSTTALSAKSAYNLTVAGAILDLGGFNNTIGSLAGVAGTTVQTLAGPATLTTGGDNTSTTYAGLITNSLGNALSLVKNGNGTFTITGANTYTGTTTHNSGGLLINNNTALGAGNFVINNAGAGTTFGSGVAGVTFANATQINGDFSVNPTGTLTASGPVTLNGTRTITGTNANTFNFAGPIGELAAGTGVVLTSVPASVFQYSGVAANTYTGLTTVQGNATLQLNKTAGLDAIGVGGLTVQNTATVTSLADQQINDAVTVLLNNTATFNLNGHKETITTLNTDAGTTTVVRLDGGGVGGTLTVNKGTVNGQIIDNGLGGNVVKNGAAGDALTLTRANAYNGTTTLNSGILNINNDAALGTSSLRINGGLVGNTDLANVSHTFANSVVVQGSFEVNGPQQLISSGPVSLAVSNTMINTLAGGLDFSGVISEVNPVSNLTFTGATNTTFGGAGGNSYSGLTSVDAGTLTLAKTGGALGVAGHLNIANGATVKFGGPAASNQQVASTSNVDVRGTFNLNGHNQAINALTGDGSVRLGDAALTAGKLTVNGGVFSGNVSDNGPSGQLVKTSSSTLALTGTNSLTGLTSVQQGTLVLNGSVGGNVIVFTPALLAGTGTVGGSLTNSGTVSPGNSPGTLHVNGNYTQNATGTLQIEIAGLGASEHDLLAVRGVASLNGTVRIVPLNNFVLQRHDKIVFLTGNQVNGVFTNEDVEIATDSKFLQGEVLYESNSVALVANQLEFSKVLKGLTPNQKAVAKALDGALNDKRLDKAIGFLDADAFGNIPHDLDLIAAEELQSLYTIGISQAHVQSSNLERRMGDIRSGSGGFSASGYSVSGGAPEYSGAFSPRGDGLSGPSGKISKELRPPTQDASLGVFITGVGEFTHVGSTSNASGFDLATGGFTLGVDYRIGENFAIGINAGYARSSADLFGNGRVSVDGAKLGVYATYFTGGFYADMAAQGGYNNYDTKRTALAGAARGGTTGGEFSAMFKTGYDIKTGGLTFGPTAGLQYTHVGFRGFTETGSLLPLTFAKQSGDSLTSKLGMKASYDWQIGGAIVRPEMQVAWQHEFDDTAFAINSRFANGAGKSFTVKGAETGRESLVLGAGVAVLWNERTSTYVYYDGEIGRTNYDSHNVSGGMRMSF